MKYFSSINNLPKQSFRRYARFGPQIFREAAALAQDLKGLKVLHLNSTAVGGGVAELLKNQIPLEKDLGLNSRWLALRGSKQFFFITKKIHNHLQGQKGFLSEPEKAYFLAQLRRPGQELERLISRQPGRCVVVLHDPQVLPLIDYLPPRVGIVLRLHIDLSSPNKTTLAFLKPFLQKAPKVIISNELYRPSWLKAKKTLVSFPAINPFSPKNRELGRRQTAKLLKRHGLKQNKPLLVQVSRFDAWKDPEGVVQAYYLAKKTIPRLQLVLEGVMQAQDDPEAASVYNHLKMEYQNDPELFLHGSAAVVADRYELWVNALQRAADVIIQKSLREGFGLTVTEALWKGKAVIGGNARGIRAQITDNVNGFIVNSPAECARRIVHLLRQPSLAKRLGRQGKLSVQRHFLLNRLILDFLKIYRGFC